MIRSHREKSRQQDATGPPVVDALAFVLPRELEAAGPPEERGIARDEIRLLVSHTSTGRVLHTHFFNLPSLLHSGDVLVINTSATMNAALNAVREDGTELELHLSTPVEGELWMVECRHPDGRAWSQGRSGETLVLPGGGRAVLISPRKTEQISATVRLWTAALPLPLAVHEYLDRFGFPIRYPYLKAPWPLHFYQTVYATEAGSAEMPSAGRPFSLSLMERLRQKGIRFAPLILHTGVASLEEHELPYREFYRVPEETARLINLARDAGHRIVAVGTTVLRALETVVNPQGRVHSAEGWTDLFLGPGRSIGSVDGLLTGLHEPRSTHLLLLEAFAGREHVHEAYRQALQGRYLFHEFGDSHLILR